MKQAATIDRATEDEDPRKRPELLLTEPFILRVGGMPVDVARSLRFPQTLGWADDVLALEAELGRQKEDIGKALETAIGHSDDQPTRRGLLALRRDIFNLRLPRDVDNARRLADQLDPAGRDRVLAWLDLRERYERERSAGEQLLTDERETRRDRLREVAVDPRLRHGLLLASPSLDRYLRTYLDAPPGPLSKRGRRIERSLLEYVFRTTCKTSPFSTLTKVALGRFRSGVGQALQATVAGGIGESHVRLNVAALVRLASVITASPEHCADLPVEVTGGWQADTNRVRYVRRTRQAGDDEAAATLDTLQENLFFLSQGTVLKELLALLESEPRLRIGDLAAQLQHADPTNRDRAEVDAYLSRLLRLSLLTVPVLGVDIHSEDPLEEFRSRVEGLDRRWSARLVERLDLIGGHLDDYPNADLATRRDLLGAIRGELTEAQHEFGLEEATTPRTLVYEDVSMPDATVVADREQWQDDLLPALDGLSRMLPLFDVTLPQRLSLKGFFLARYGRGGRCQDTLRFLHEFHRDFFDEFLKANQRRRPFDADGEYVPLTNWLRIPEIGALDDARRELTRRMRQAYADHPSDDQELVIDDTFIDAVADALPDTGGVFDPRSFFLQVADDGGKPLGVLNRSYSGLTLLFSRFAHCLPYAGEHGLADELRGVLSTVRPAGAVFAELTGGYDTTNLNLHPAVTPYELVCPGETSSRPVSAQIPVSDLIVQHDEESDRVYLRSQSLGTEVVPVYLGFLQPMVLPEVQRGLLLFSHTSMAQLDLWNGVDKPLQGESIGGHPRVRYRNLVLVRRTWKMHPGYVPRQRNGMTDSDWFLAWQRWRRENGLPRRVFATADTDLSSGNEDDTGANRPRPKPQYIDFDSYFSLSLLEQIAGTATARLVMQEMLPDIEQLWLHANDGSYVTEQTLELVRTSRRGAAATGLNGSNWPDAE